LSIAGDQTIFYTGSPKTSGDRRKILSARRMNVSDRAENGIGRRTTGTDARETPTHRRKKTGDRAAKAADRVAIVGDREEKPADRKENPSDRRKTPRPYGEMDCAVRLYSTAPLRVLVADGDADTRAFYRTALELAGWGVLEA
jgi:hypothetical protein